MIGFFDVYYNDDGTAQGACILTDTFNDDVPKEEHIVTIDKVEPYESGFFYKRELPIILKMINVIGKEKFDMIVIDGYVNLTDKHHGLGYYLYKKLGESIPIIGVAKNKYKTENQSIEILRGFSEKPLFITSIGIEVAKAAKNIGFMRGDNRLPTIIKMADSLSRSKL